MKDFTPDSRLYGVRHCKQFSDFKKYILCPRQFARVMQVYKIKHLKWFYNVNAQVMADSLNELRRRICAGERLFELLYGDVGVYSFIADKGAPYVLVLPGGGYGDVCSLVEGFPVALALNKMGYNAFIGQYSVGKRAAAPAPCRDVANILKYIAERYVNSGICAAEYAICGFSAGGHLAATWCVDGMGYAKYGMAKPAAVMLCYPVITMGEYTHGGSRKNLLGKNPSPELVAEYSIEGCVTADYPKTFIWQCTRDDVVPYKNSQLMAQALANAGVPYEFMSVEDTRHGLGLGTGTPAYGWLERAVAFWRKL